MEGALTYMDKIWILVEQRNGNALASALQLAAGARQFASTVEAITWGGDGSLGVELGQHGVSRILDVGSIGDSMAGPTVGRAIAERIRGGDRPDAIFFPSSYSGRDIAARLSARLDLPVITNVVGISAEGEDLITEHSVFGGSQTVRARFTSDGPALFIVRPKSFEAAETGGPAAATEDLPVPDLGGTDAAKVTKRQVDARSGPSLDDASIVVSGGRGLGSAENFQFVEELATLLHGAPGASRAIVDAGWVPYSYQVGQTGKVVAPEVYLAFGISGAIQHRVGVKGAKHIIAIDIDPSAPIFGVADLGVIGDAVDLLPRLIASLKARTG
jgi:electron transfer flavoprotein alpha subunit